jgi:hypothetical protein
VFVWPGILFKKAVYVVKNVSVIISTTMLLKTGVCAKKGIPWKDPIVQRPRVYALEVKSWLSLETILNVYARKVL